MQVILSTRTYLTPLSFIPLRVHSTLGSGKNSPPCLTVVQMLLGKVAGSGLNQEWVGDLVLKPSSVFTTKFLGSEEEGSSAWHEKEDMFLEFFSRAKYLYPLVNMTQKNKEKIGRQCLHNS